MELKNPLIGVITLNTGGVKFCGKNKKSFGCKPSNFVADAIEYTAKTKCDLIVIGLQEYSQPFSYLLDAFEMGFLELNYKLISTTYQQGVGKEGIRSLNLAIFANQYSSFKFKVRTEELSYRCKHQTLGKGAIGTLLNVVSPDSLSDNSLYIVTTHLPFDDKKPNQANQERIDCLNEMIENFQINETDSFLVFGDLNFRTNLNYDVQIQDFLQNKKWIRDSVSEALSKNLNVVKTCKLKLQRNIEECKSTQYKDCYDLGKENKPRIPSYCDRILFTSDLSLEGYETIDTGNLNYTDHLMVIGLFSFDISKNKDDFFEM